MSCQSTLLDVTIRWNCMHLFGRLLRTSLDCLLLEMRSELCNATAHTRNLRANLYVKIVTCRRILFAFSWLDLRCCRHHARRVRQLPSTATGATAPTKRHGRNCLGRGGKTSLRRTEAADHGGGICRQRAGGLLGAYREGGTLRLGP